MFITLESFLGVCEVGEEFLEELALPCTMGRVLPCPYKCALHGSWFQISTVIICSEICIPEL